MFPPSPFLFDIVFVQFELSLKSEINFRSFHSFLWLILFYNSGSMFKKQETRKQNHHNHAETEYHFQEKT